MKSLMAVSCLVIFCESHQSNIMKVLIILCLISACFCVDDDGGQYVPDDSGRYIPTDEGQYIPDYSGRYIHDGSGAYKNDGSGKYSGFNDGNFLASSTRTKPIIQPIVKTKRIPSTTLAPITHQPLNTYNNYQEGKWKILKQLSDIDTDGYHWEYETENKIIAEESGKLHNVGTNDETMRSIGFYQYTGPDNVVYAVEYTADENGFFPIGNHLPTPPPIPEELAKALKSENKLKK